MSLSTSDQIKPFDRNVLLQRCLGNAALVDKLMAALMTSLPRDKSDLQSAIEASDLTSIARLSHRLKGTASNIGAVPMSGSSDRVEQSARKNDFENVLLHWRELAQQIDQLILALEAQNFEGAL